MTRKELTFDAFKADVSAQIQAKRGKKNASRQIGNHCFRYALDPRRYCYLASVLTKAEMARVDKVLAWRREKLGISAVEERMATLDRLASRAERRAFLQRATRHDNWSGFFDGSAGGAVDPIGMGWVLLDETQTEVAAKRLGRGSGTRAEAVYRALIDLLEYLREHHLAGAQLWGDNLRVVEQVTGRMACRSRHLLPFRNRAGRLLRLTSSSLGWVSRDQNRRADELSRQAFHVLKENPTRSPQGSEPSRESPLRNTMTA